MFFQTFFAKDFLSCYLSIGGKFGKKPLQVWLTFQSLINFVIWNCKAVSKAFSVYLYAVIPSLHAIKMCTYQLVGTAQSAGN